MNRANPMPFRKTASQLRTMANASTLEFTEGMHRFMDVDKTPELTLAFDFPSGAAAEPPSLRKVSAGQLIQESEHEGLVRAMVQRGVLMAAGRAAGSPNDPAKTLETMKTGDAKRPRGEFLSAMAQELFDRTDLFGPSKPRPPEPHEDGLPGGDRGNRRGTGHQRVQGAEGEDRGGAEEDQTDVVSRGRRLR